MSAMRAIRTEYKGVLFMSTLEADWAKTLDSKDFRMVWQNEPEGLRLPDGQNYRPDLYLPRTDTWVEVKGPHNQRIDKPAELARACQHAPGCEFGMPTVTMRRPATVDPAHCVCGFGADFPFQNVVVARPATGSKAVWEAPHGMDVTVVVLACPVCGQRCFTHAEGIPVCRRCWQDASGGAMYRSGSLLFHRVEPPRGRSASAAAAKRAKALSR